MMCWVGGFVGCSKKTRKEEEEEYCQVFCKG